MRALIQKFNGSGLRARAMRGSAWTVFGYGTSQALRLASNLILTRLLFPEAFGLMALVMVFMQGLNMFSDVGVGPSIMGSKRGDDQDFLDTAWTIQVIRGVSLWVFSCVMAVPVSWIYNEPLLAYLVPVAGLGLLISGFNPTRLESGQRHLNLGRITVLQIITQVIGIIAAIIFALIFRSVWAFVLSGIVSVLAQLALYHWGLPGPTNRFRWEKPAAHELIHFGKWIFLSTVCGFLFSQSDKIILGKFTSFEILGIYNIGYFLASFPLLLSISVVHKMLIPLYRERPPSASVENFQTFRKIRFGLTAAILAFLSLFAFFGIPLVDFLYDERYVTAGPIVVLVACAQIPAVIVLTYDQAALASGDSKRFFVLAASKAFFMIAAILIGVQVAGLFGTIVGQGIALLFVYPVVVWLSRHQGVWDPLHDGFYALIGGFIVFFAVWLNFNAISAMMVTSGL